MLSNDAAGRGAGGADRGRGGLPEAEREGDRGVAAPVQLGGLHDVAVRCVRRDRRRARGWRRAGSARRTGCRRSRWSRPGTAGRRGARRTVGTRVVAVDRVGDRGGVRADQGGGGRVDGRVVGAAVGGAAAAVAVDGGVVPHVELERAGALQPGLHHHGVPLRVGEVVGDQRVAAAALGAGDPAGHPGRVERGTVYVMSRVCRSVNVEPSVTTYCSVSTLVLSMVGS